MELILVIHSEPAIQGEILSIYSMVKDALINAYGKYNQLELNLWRFTSLYLNMDLNDNIFDSYIRAKYTSY